ncbi:spore germination protein [Paenibacillus sp. GCM10027627]|uniref:spore germination protein n=1 Tax=unclassified Paenibacillus TaxID=185978 RepID=UPI003639C3CC
MREATKENELYPELEAALTQGKLDGTMLKKAFSAYADLHFPSVPIPEASGRLTAIFCEGMIDRTQLNDHFYGLCQFALVSAGLADEGDGGPEELPIVEHGQSIEQMLDALFTGKLILFAEGEARFWIVFISNIPQRQPEESNTEISIKGPRDAFTEEMCTNIGLIRKRMRTSMLFSEQFEIGTMSKTRVTLLYLKNKADETIVKEARKRLSTLEAESILSSGQLEQWIADRTYSLLPLLDYIGRPDFVVETLLRGRLAIIVDGSPMALIGPVNFLELLKSPEDVHHPYYYVMTQRLLRLLGLLLSIFLPGFWIAMASVNPDQIPFSLVSTVVISREGVPLPLFLETFLLLFLFELLREAGVRMPKAVGQTIGIVGGLIIGDSLIRAGLASPTLLVVIAIAAVATFSLVNQSLSGSVSLFRAVILLVSAFLGIYGFMLCLFACIIYICQLSSFGVPYVDPIVSFRYREWLDALLMNPFKRRRVKPMKMDRKMPQKGDS